MTFEPQIISRLVETRRGLEKSGDLRTPELLDRMLANFRAKYGPERLRATRGRELLELMHLRGRSSLVYWLEFKDDDEFAYRAFGSIAGGSAFKFGLFQRAATGEWTVGSAAEQRTVSVDEAASIAEQQRDQLLAGVDLVQALGLGAQAAEYAELERRLAKAAPDVYDSAWAHKYLYLLAPERLDDFHSFPFQSFMSMKLFQAPPPDAHRYEAAFPFVALARQLDWRMPHLTQVMNACFGEPHGYWRVGTVPGGGGASQWPRMRDSGCIAVGFDSIGDLSDVAKAPDGRELLRARMAPEHPHAPTLTNQSGQLYHFVAKASPGDIVVAADGDDILGVGRITGAYAFEAGQPTFRHARPVQWLSVDHWRLPEPNEVRQTTFKAVKRPANVIAIEAHLIGAKKPQLPPPVVKQFQPQDGGPYAVPALPGIGGRVQAALERKGQVILYGPPGTGKTYVAEQVVRDLAALQGFNRPFDALSPAQRDDILGRDGWHGYVRLVSFHPGYGYEDFIEGYRPSADDGQLRFVSRDGIFKSLCADARARPDRRFYLIVDELNRGDVPRILGELMTVLELDKRNKDVLLPLSGERFRIPENVRIVGTMNTADRSIALLDAALRRRFAFVELMPEYDLLDGPGAVDLAALLRRLNALIRQHVKRDARNLQVGHAYFLERGKPISDLRRLAGVLQDDVVPLIQEYCYDDYDALRAILGPGFVAQEGGAILSEVFERMSELASALRHFEADLVRDSGADAADKAATSEDDV